MLADSYGPTVTPCQSLGGDSWQQVTSLNANLGQDGKQPNIELVGLMYHGQSGLLRWTLNLVPKRPPLTTERQERAAQNERHRVGLPVPWI